MKTVILVLIASISFAQRVSIVSPPFLIKSGTQYAALGSQKSFFTGNAKRWYYYKSDSLGSVTKLKWKLTDYIATDSSTAVSSLPDGFLVYDLPCSLYDYQQVATWTPEATEYIFRIRIFDGLAWMTQDVDANTFVVRGKNVLERNDIVITDSTAIDSVCYASIQGELTGTEGLAPPQFPIPSGYYEVSINGTIAYSTVAPLNSYEYIVFGPYDNDGDFQNVTISTEPSIIGRSTSSSIVNGSTIYIDNDFQTTLTASKYYGLYTGSSYMQLTIDTLGIISVANTVVFGSLAILEENLAASSLASNNYINWEAFDDMEVDAVWVGYGQFPQFSTDLSGNSLMDGLPPQIKKGFKNVGWVNGYNGVADALNVPSLQKYKYAEAISHVPTLAEETDHSAAEWKGYGYVQQNEGAGVNVGTYLWDNEGAGANKWEFNFYAAKGAVEKMGAFDGNNYFIWLDYRGGDLPPFNGMSNYYYGGSGDRKLFRWPSFDPTKTEVDRTMSAAITPWLPQVSFANHNYRRTLQIYLSAGLPDDVSLYQKIGSAYVTDELGDRLPKFEDIQSTLRGKSFYLRNVGDRESVNGLLNICTNGIDVGFTINGGGCIYKTAEELIEYTKHQSLDAITGLSAQVSIMVNKLIARNKIQFGTSDISEYREDATWIYTPLMSLLTETKPWGQAGYSGQPMSNLQINTLFFSAAILHGGLQLWNGAGAIEPHPMGQGFSEINPYVSVNGVSVYNTTPYDMSQISNITAGMQYCQYLKDNYGLFSDTDKILTFMATEKVQDGEIIALGRMNGDNVFLILAEPRLDIGETMDVNIYNGVDLLQTVTVTARELKRVILPSLGGTPAASDIHISYVPLKEKDDGGSTAFDLTGDLIGQHVYIP
jgi:hypothetical protein